MKVTDCLGSIWYYMPVYYVESVFIFCNLSAHPFNTSATLIPNGWLRITQITWKYFFVLQAIATAQLETTSIIQLTTNPPLNCTTWPIVFAPVGHWFLFRSSQSLMQSPTKLEAKLVLHDQVLVHLGDFRLGKIRFLRPEERGGFNLLQRRIRGLYKY